MPAHKQMVWPQAEEEQRKVGAVGILCSLIVASNVP
jgi:hypothetical protein